MWIMAFSGILLSTYSFKNSTKYDKYNSSDSGDIVKRGKASNFEVVLREDSEMSSPKNTTGGFWRLCILIQRPIKFNAGGHYFTLKPESVMSLKMSAWTFVRSDLDRMKMLFDDFNIIQYYLVK